MAAKRGCVCRRMYYCLILELCPMMAEPEQKKKRIFWCCFSSSMIVDVCMELCVYVKWFVAWVGLSLGWLVVGGPFCIYIVYYRLPRNWEMDISLGKTGRHQPMQSNRNDVLLVAMMLLQSAHHLLCPSSTFLALLTPAELKPFSADSSLAGSTPTRLPGRLPASEPACRPYRRGHHASSLISLTLTYLVVFCPPRIEDSGQNQHRRYTYSMPTLHFDKATRPVSRYCACLTITSAQDESTFRAQRVTPRPPATGLSRTAQDLQSLAKAPEGQRSCPGRTWVNDIRHHRHWETGTSTLHTCITLQCRNRSAVQQTTAQ